MAYFFFNSKDNYRKDDYKEVEKGLNSSNAEERKVAQKAAYFLKQENTKIKSMRESLVRAHREGNKEEIKDIHDFVSSHAEYRHGR